MSDPKAKRIERELAVLLTAAEHETTQQSVQRPPMAATALQAMSAAEVAREIVALGEWMDAERPESYEHQAAADRWCILQDLLSHTRAETPADALALLSGILNRVACLIDCQYDGAATKRQLRAIERSAAAVARIIEGGTPERLADFGEFGYLARATGDVPASSG